jgi:hypothetical protein
MRELMLDLQHSSCNISKEAEDICRLSLLYEHLDDPEKRDAIQYVQKILLSRIETDDARTATPDREED